MPTLASRRTSRLVALVVIAIGAVVAPLVLPTPADAAKKGDVSFSISPASVTAGSSAQLTLTAANALTSSNSIGSVQVVVPASFTDVTVGSVISPASGFVVRTASCSADSPSGCGAAGTTLVEVGTPSGGAAKVLPGQSLVFTINVRPATKGTSTWKMEAKNSSAWSTGQVLSQAGPDPTVDVLGAPATLSFTTPPPSPVTAGDTFGTTVSVLDSDGALTSSAASVILSGTGLQGITVQSAVGGSASFTGLSLEQAGTITLTASSDGLTSTTQSVQVRPSTPAELRVTPPTGSVGAGGSFTVGVLVRDRFGNVVDTPQSVTVTRAATTSVPSQSVTQASADGNVSVDLTAPTVTGDYRYTVSSGTVPPVSFGVTVTAGDPVALTIDAVTPAGGLTLLAKDQPFSVTVTARDAFGNPAAFTGTVSLSSSGGTGSGAGSLTAPDLTFTGSATATVDGVTYSDYGNSITLRASATGLTDGTRFIDVTQFTTTKPASPGQALNVNLTGCTDATPQVPVCVSLLLPNGAAGPVTVAQGECDPFTPCLTGPQNEALLFNGIADLTDGSTNLYTRRAPATIVLRCDKTLCGGAGVNAFPLLFQETGWAPTRFEVAPPCPAKGRIGSTQRFCQDFRQNNRDNAGDLVAYLLFLEDAKATFK
jgi:hypothetical protein